jgi:glycosyltransferase involved in cell wall biosynthesis
MHVVQVLAALNVGGSELVATELSEFLKDQGHRVTVIAADGPIGERLRRCGAEHLDWKIGKKRLGTFRLIRRLADWLEAEKPDLVHVHSRFPAWVCWLAIRRLDPVGRPRFVTTMHGHYSVSRYSSVMARGHRTIAVSEHIRNYTLSNYPYMGSSGIVTIHGGASREDFPHNHRPPEGWLETVETEFPELKGRRWLLFPGRVTRWKGHVAFIQLMAQLADVDDLHGVIVGGCRAGSRYRAELEALVGRYGLDDRITFTGDRLDIRDWMAASALALNLSDDPPEAFGRTVLETLCLGRPMVAWNHGGAAEIMAEMFPQGAVEPRNHHELESRVRAFLTAPPQVPPSNAFSLEYSMQRHLEVYEELLKEPAL